MSQHVKSIPPLDTEVETPIDKDTYLVVTTSARLGGWELENSIGFGGSPLRCPV